MSRIGLWGAIQVLALTVWSLQVVLPGQLAAQGCGEEWDVTQPRGKTRVISFTTDEGTWLSVDVSPDGQTIAFDMVGEIWLLPMEGGDARPLTKASGMALNFHPTFSPDGSKIAFISDRDGQDNVWVMDADGANPRQVSKQKHSRMFLPVWTPDGEYIIGRLGAGSNLRDRGELRMYHVGGGEGINLTGDDIFATWASVSRDGRFIYFSEQVKFGFGDIDPVKGLHQLRSLDRWTGNILEITSGTERTRSNGRSSGGAIAPEISPDGRWLAFGRRIADGNYVIGGHEYGPRTALWLRDLETGRERIIMDPITPDGQERNNSGPLPRYAWTPDGGSIVITEGGKLWRLDVATGAKQLIPFVARVEEQITEQVYFPTRVGDGPVRVRMMRWHTASPQGRLLAFVAVGKVWVVELPEGRPERLTPDTFAAMEFSPSWSPDGQWLAFTSWSDEEAGHVWKVQPDGRGLQRLTSVPGVYLNPDWSADGRQIVVARGSGQMLRGRMPSDEKWFRLEALPASGGNVREIVVVESGQGGAHVVAPKFGPDERVFYLANRGGDNDSLFVLESVRLDGLDIRAHARIPYADEAALSPDGRRVAFQRGDNIYLAPLPWPGANGEPVELSADDSPVSVKRLSLEGGNFPNWMDSTTLEWGSANHYFRHDLRTGASDTFEIALEVPRYRAEGSIALRNARVVTMAERGILLNADIVVRDGRIASVGPTGTVEIPGAAKVIDLAGKTVVPGYIDTHLHMAREGRGILPQRSWEMAANLAYGVTTALDPSAWGENIFSMAENAATGVQVGPRIFSTGSSLSARRRLRYGILESYQDAVHEVNRLASYGARTIKEYQQRRRDQRQWVVEAAREAGLMVTPEGDTDPHETLALVMDGHTGIEHPILNVPLYRDVTEFLGQSGIFYSPTLVVGGAGPWGDEFWYQSEDIWKSDKLRRFTPWRWLEPHTRRRLLRPRTDYPFPLHAQGVADVIAAGGYGTIGAHGQQQGLASHFEMWLYASAMDALTVLRMATIYPARMIGIEEDVGTIEAGKLADLVVLNSDPLNDIRNTADIRYVMKEGVLYDGETLDELWPQARPFGDFYWRQEGVRSGWSVKANSNKGSR